MPCKKKRDQCYLYLRVSTMEQANEGYSLAAQRDRLLKEAEHRDIAVAAEFSDEGKSGKNTTGRPRYTEMMRRIQSGNPDDVTYVLVFKLSRFGRNAADVLNGVQTLRDCGVNLLAVEDGLDSSGPMGRMMITVMSAVAEIERENIQAQTKAGQMQKSREGLWNGGPAPYGYRLKDGLLVVHKDEAKVVQLIFDKYAHTNMGYSKLAKWLNENGYIREVRKGSHHSTFTDFFVKTVLDNPIYVGRIVYGRFGQESIPGTRNEYHYIKRDKYEEYEGKHEAIVSDELWQEVHAKRQALAGKPPEHHGPNNVYVLSGIVRCPVCGAPMYGNVNKRKKKDGSGEYYPDIYYYFCKNAKNATGTSCTYTHNVRAEILDKQVIIIFQQAIKSANFRRATETKIGSPDNLDELTATLESLQAARNKEEQKKSRLLDKIMNLDADNDQYDATYNDLQGVLIQINRSISTLDGQIEDASARLYNAKSEAISVDQIFRAFHFLMDYIESWPAESQRSFLHATLERVEIFPEIQPDGRLVKSIEFKFPVSLDGGQTIGEIIEVDPGDDDDNPPPDDDPPPGDSTTPPKDSPSGSGTTPPDVPPSGGDISHVENYTPNPNGTMMLLVRSRNRSTDSLQALALLSPSLEPKSLYGQWAQAFPS